MTSSSPFLVYFSLLCLLTRVSLSVPTAFRHVRNLTVNHLAIDPSVSTLDLVLPLELTPALRDPGSPYRVPNTEITMFFWLGFPVDPRALNDTILAAKNYCELQIQRSGDIPLPHTEDPFDDDLGYGAAIYVVSANIHYRLTWSILEGVMQGLWDFLVETSRNVEAEFSVVYKKRGIVGRGTITKAQEGPSVQR